MDVKYFVRFTKEVLLFPIVFISALRLVPILLNSYIQDMLIIGIVVRLLLLVFIILFAARLVNLKDVLIKPRWLTVLIGSVVVLLLYYVGDQAILGGKSLTEWSNVLFSTAVVATVEEFLFRVVVFFQALKFFGVTVQNIWKAMVAASLIFSISHIMGFIGHQVNFLDIFNISVLTFGAGLFLQALFLRFNNIMLPIAIHFANNLRAHLSVPSSHNQGSLSEESSMSNPEILLNVVVFVSIGFAFLFISKKIFETTRDNSRLLHIKSLTS